MSTIITLSVLALLLVVAEVFLPGAVLGIIGFILMVWASVVAFQTYGLLAGIGVFFINAILSIILAVGLIKALKGTRFGNRIFLSGFVQGDSIGGRDEQESLIGKEGRTLTRMTPSGSVLIEGKQYDAVSQSGQIDHSQTVEVVEDNRFRILVRAVSDRKK